MINSNDMNADWIGKLERRFRWSKFRFDYGNMHYTTNCCGDTEKAWWVWKK